MSRRKFAAFDIDGTLIRWQLYHAVTDNLHKHGYIQTGVYREVKRQRMLWKQRKTGFGDYERQLVKTFEASLKQLPADRLDAAIEEVIEEYQEQVYTFTRDLVTDLLKQGYLLFAISGSHQEIVEKLARHYGFHDWVGGRYERREGVFTGNYSGPLGRKHEVLAELVAKHDATYRGSMAVGDSSGDISMLAAVEQPIAFNPEKALFEHAKDNGWAIVIERKNMVYRLEERHGAYVLV